MGSFQLGLWFGMALALVVIALLLKQLAKASDGPEAGTAASTASTAATADEQGVDAGDAAAIEQLLRAASRTAFLGDAELYADESGEAGSVLLRGGELREAAVAALDGVMQGADAERAAAELATADPRCLVALLQQRLRGLRRALLAGEGTAHSGAIVDAACALDEASAAAAANDSAAADGAEMRAVAGALASLHAELARLAPANRRVLARLLRHLHARAVSQRNDNSAAALGKQYADCVFAPSTARAEAAAVALVRGYPMLRPAFSLSSKERTRFFGRTSAASRRFLAAQAAAGSSAAGSAAKKGKKNGAAAASAPPHESAAWANLFAARWFGEYGASAALLRGLREDVQKSLGSMEKRPAFLLPIQVRSVSLGAALPQLQQVAAVPTDTAAQAPGELALSLSLLYERGIAFNLTVPVAVAGITVPLAVRVQVTRLEGQLLLFLPAPHADRGAAWISFERAPDLDLAVDLLYGEQLEQDEEGSGSRLALATVPAVGDFIRSKVCAAAAACARSPSSATHAAVFFGEHFFLRLTQHRSYALRSKPRSCCRTGSASTCRGTRRQRKRTVI